MWLASFKQHSAVHGDVGKSATSVGLRAPAGRFDAAKSESIDTGDGRLCFSVRDHSLEEIERTCRNKSLIFLAMTPYFNFNFGDDFDFREKIFLVRDL